MSEFYNIALIVEGKTDFAVFTKLMEFIIREKASSDDADFVFSLLQPVASDSFGGYGQEGSGWKGVRNFLSQTVKIAGNFERFISPSFGGSYDLVLLQLDADVVNESELGLDISCPPVEEGIDALKDILLVWMKVKSFPENVLITIPSMALESWIVAAITNRKLPKNWECINNPSNHLPKVQFDDRKRRPEKTESDYVLLADLLVRKWKKAKSHNTQAVAFEEQLLLKQFKE